MIHNNILHYLVRDNVCTDATEMPSNRVHLDRVIWAVIGFTAGVALTVILCLLLFACCYCTCFSARKEKRTKYDVQKGKSKPFSKIATAIIFLDRVY